MARDYKESQNISPLDFFYRCLDNYEIAKQIFPAFRADEYAW